MGNPTSIQILGRIALIEEDHLLIAHQIGREHTFLPGGHVESGESITATIHREAREEFGCELEVGDFIGALEHAYTDLGRDYHEINFVFAGRLCPARFPALIPSLEGHLEFFWQPVDQLDQINLLPSPMISLVQEYVRKQQKGVWASTMTQT